MLDSKIRDGIINTCANIFKGVDFENMMWGDLDVSESELKPYQFLEDFKNDDISEIHAGVTKIVFVLKDYPDYVVKVPFLGVFDFDEDKNVLFAGKKNDTRVSVTRKWDYCEREAKIFEMACENNVEKFFAGTYFLDFINDYPFYISDRIMDTFEDHYDSWDSSESERSSLSENSYEDALKISRAYYSSMSNNDMAIFVENFGTEDAEEFAAFCYDNHINDLHDGNLGLRFDGSPCVIDYSGFFR